MENAASKRKSRIPVMPPISSPEEEDIVWRPKSQRSSSSLRKSTFKIKTLIRDASHYSETCQAQPQARKSLSSVANSINMRDWSPMDDGIEMHLPHASREQVDAYVSSILYGPSTKRRLPAFVQLCSQFASPLTSPAKSQDKLKF